MPPEVICLGETMALMAPESGGPLARAELLRLRVAGAESTVAQYLSDLGHRTAWASRLGRDPFGARVAAALAGSGVDTTLVGYDEQAPTGCYFKDPAPEGSRVHYYRRGSAASRMSAADARALPLDGVRLLHLTGITPALSASCAELVDTLLTRAAEAGVPVSFDVNHRAALWEPGRAAPVLRELAARADTVLVGRDEAEELWGTTTAEAVREHLGPRGTLVVKDGAVGATEFPVPASASEPVFVPAPAVDVVEPVGAGDAFAAGYLSGALRGLPSRERLLLGHRLAARTLRSLDDYVPVPAAERGPPPHRDEPPTGEH
ncbi:sugar kinase [Streptomyces sp. HNM0574]|uniref:sugar kinase n=1 Tax=Streptomyces sp. HNM0574 TaxID=2714954 RepID=UPI00321749F3